MVSPSQESSMADGSLFQNCTMTADHQDVCNSAILPWQTPCRHPRLTCDNLEWYGVPVDQEAIVLVSWVFDFGLSSKIEQCVEAYLSTLGSSVIRLNTSYAVRKMSQSAKVREVEAQHCSGNA